MSARELLSNLPAKKRKRITAFGSDSVLSKVTEWISTGCLPLDICMGGGNPVGRMVEIYGDTSTGKSLLADHILAETQAAGGIGVLFDTETATSETMMRVTGINLDDLVYCIPDTIEELYDDFMAIMAAKEKSDPNGLMTVVWDSVAATSTQGEINAIKKKGMGAATMGVHARYISQLCRTINTLVGRHRLSFVFINQTREKIGVMFGSNVATFGGKAIGFYSSVRLEMKLLSRIKEDEDSDDVIGVNVRVGVVKNKVGPPFRKCEFPIIFDQGIDEPGAIMWWMKDRGLLTGGAYKKFTLNDGQEVKFRHREWDDVFDTHEQAIRDVLMEDAGWPLKA